LPPPPLPRGRPPKKKELDEIPPGTIAWRQGLFWKLLPPPYRQKDLRTLKSAPAGAYKFAVGEDSAYKTIQVLGGMPARDVKDIDIGIALVDITRKGRDVTARFKRDVEDVYKGKTVTEKIPRLPISKGKGVPKYAKDKNGRIYLTEKHKLKLGKVARQPSVIDAIGFKEKKVRSKKITSPDIPDRYYLGHKLRPVDLGAIRI